MYDHILGEIVSTQPARVVLRAGGVGFELKVPMGVSSDLSIGDTVCLYTILHVSDGNSTLLGFRENSEREFARMLMSVSGVGPSMSLAVLSVYSVGQVARAIVSGEHRVLKAVKGVGAKIAERLCLELRDKVGELQLGAAGAPTSAVLIPQSCDDAIGALVTLGFTEKEARKKVSLFHERLPEATTEELVTSVLRG